MNRIILIGNGFDLAHGLKTSYADFIDWYWKEWGKRLLHGLNKVEEDGLVSFKLNKELHSLYWADVWRWYYKRQNPFEPWDENLVLELAQTNKELGDYVITSPFLEELCMQLKNRKWVDIENVYFKHLSNDSEKPEKVNYELSVIRNRLIDYLNETQNAASKDLFKAEIQEMMFAPFDKKDFAIGTKSIWKNMLEQRIRYGGRLWEEIIASYLCGEEQEKAYREVIDFMQRTIGSILPNGIAGLDDNRIPKNFLLPDRILLLNFNYTNVADFYLPNVERISVNHIHGELTKPESVIFGYGDEMDENYKKLSNKNDNEYLNNIKSIKYLESPNYRNLLDFIESDTYQVFIMGHSCGNSDRTLLNTLFEHKNCVSIKPFYFIKKDGTDNYMELVQNISRNFTDMKLMRDRVVNKTFCEPYSDARVAAS